MLHAEHDFSSPIISDAPPPSPLKTVNIDLLGGSRGLPTLSGLPAFDDCLVNMIREELVNYKVVQSTNDCRLPQRLYTPESV